MATQTNNQKLNEIFNSLSAEDADKVSMSVHSQLWEATMLKIEQDDVFQFLAIKHESQCLDELTPDEFDNVLKTAGIYDVGFIV